MENRRGAEDNVSNPKADNFPFDVMQVGDSFEFQRVGEKGIFKAAQLCKDHSIDGKKFFFSIMEGFIRIGRTT